MRGGLYDVVLGRLMTEASGTFKAKAEKLVRDIKRKLRQMKHRIVFVRKYKLIISMLMSYRNN